MRWTDGFRPGFLAPSIVGDSLAFSGVGEAARARSTPIPQSRGLPSEAPLEIRGIDQRDVGVVVGHGIGVDGLFSPSACSPPQLALRERAPCVLSKDFSDGRLPKSADGSRLRTGLGLLHPARLAAVGDHIARPVNRKG
jgi:hypothetical protein